MRVTIINNIRIWIKKNKQPGLMHRAGQVLIEFALAVVGLVILAFLTARVAPWLNQSLVERDTSFQQTRKMAGSSRTLVGFAGPQPIRLIGSQTGATSGLPPQPPGPSTEPPTCGIGNDLDDLAAKRASAAKMLENNIISNLLPKLKQLEIEIEALITEANEIHDDAEDLEDIERWIRDIDAGRCGSVPSSQIPNSCIVTVQGSTCPCSGSGGGGGCQPGSCPVGELCDTVTGLCVVDCVNCGTAGQSCCQSSCAPRSACDAPNTCISGTCVAPNSACSNCGGGAEACCDPVVCGMDCVSPNLCINGTCVSSSACAYCGYKSGCCPDPNVENCRTCGGDCGCAPGFFCNKTAEVCAPVTCKIDKDCGAENLICVSGLCEEPPDPPLTCVGDVCTYGGFCCTENENCLTCPGDCGFDLHGCAGVGQACTVAQQCHPSFFCCTSIGMCAADEDECPP